MDVRQYEVMVFDELYLFPREMLCKIHRFMQNHPEIRFLATGDKYQNPTISNVNHRYTKGTAWSTQEIVQFMFPTTLRLRIMKRVKNEADKPIYAKIKDDLFNEHKSVKQVVQSYKKHFASTTDDIAKVNTKMNVCYTNETRAIVNRHIQAGKPIKKGQQMVLKGSRNAMYTIVSVKKRTVKDSLGKLHNVTANQWNLFELPYCWTSYTMQGLTHDGEMTIFDIHKPPFMTAISHAQSFWTAITRATSLKDIHMFTGTTKHLKEHGLDKLIDRKLTHHAEYDKEHDVYDEENFVTRSWVKRQLKRIGRRCSECGTQVTWSGNRQFSIDRIINVLGHTTINCRIICCSCNKGKH